MPGVKSATLLAGNKKLTAVNTADGVVLRLPAAAPDNISSAVVLRIRGKPETESKHL